MNREAGGPGRRSAHGVRSRRGRVCGMQLESRCAEPWRSRGAVRGATCTCLFTFLTVATARRLSMFLVISTLPKKRLHYVPLPFVRINRPRFQVEPGVLLSCEPVAGAAWVRSEPDTETRRFLERV